MTNLSDAKMNFKSSHKDNIWCSICNLFPESQRHIGDCYVLRSILKDKVNFDGFNYEHIDSTLEEQEKFAQVFHKLIEERRKLLNENDFQEEDQSTEDIDTFMDEDLLDAT